MLTDFALKQLKPKEKSYKVADRDGLYVHVSITGVLSFRFDYRLNGRRETLTFGTYGGSGLSLALAREKLVDAKRTVSEGRSPAQEKQREKRRQRGAKTFGEHAEQWFAKARMADSTKAMRRAIYDRELKPAWGKRQLGEITPDDLRAFCGKIVDRGAPATAIHARDILKQIYVFARLNGSKAANPADEVGPAAIATFVPKDRSLSPTEIRIMLRELEHVATLPTIRLGMKFYLLTMVRKSELQDATWDEVDFENAVWSIPKERMKRSKPHNVYLSRQSLDILIALKTCAGNSPYLLPSRYEAGAPMSRATFNRVTYAVVERAKRDKLPLEPFTVHDLRRTASTLLNELGFNSDWVEKCLAHEDGRSSRGVYNKAEYEHQRRHMMQEWADIVDAWVAGRKRVAVLIPPSISLPEFDPALSPGESGDYEHQVPALERTL
ncbi:Site-specific recombinase XerD [Sphingobium sp. AP50]|uniref:tyrosine-type recombinase/integrase n=1 Tax=Sphingobium sp. AP50 TaxID=1884369 RepID=UPI0008B87CD6|nr:tyrosine-type recombinase/integrase [Sphingobium sp. AP50]SEI96428.1 Site-specific recombinase XerD [Sphingobium sp. AP50]